MTTTIHATRESTAVPVRLNNTAGTTGLSVVVAVLQAGTSPESHLDFADLTFKTSGHSTIEAVVAEVGGGKYAIPGGLDISSLIGLLPSTDYLILEFRISGSETGRASELIDLAHTERVRDVYRIEGLDAANPLVVSPTKRRVPASGSLIDQDVTTVASTVTVDRV